MKCNKTCTYHIHEKNDKFATCTLTNSLLPYPPGSMDNELPESCPNQKKKAWLRDLGIDYTATPVPNDYPDTNPFHTCYFNKNFLDRN